MGIFDRARDAGHEHEDKIDPVVDRLAGEADRRSGGKHGARIDLGADAVKDERGDFARRDTPTEPGQPA